MKRFFSLISLLFLSLCFESGLKAQTVKGTVKDASGPLAGVSVIESG